MARQSDTSEDVAAMQTTHYRSMTGAERFAMALEMSRMTRSFTESRIRAEHPEWSDRQVIRELLRIAFYPAELPPDFR